MVSCIFQPYSRLDANIPALSYPRLVKGQLNSSYHWSLFSYYKIIPYSKPEACQVKLLKSHTVHSGTFPYSIWENPPLPTRGPPCWMVLLIMKDFDSTFLLFSGIYKMSNSFRLLVQGCTKNFVFNDKWCFHRGLISRDPVCLPAMPARARWVLGENYQGLTWTQFNFNITVKPVVTLWKQKELFTRISLPNSPATIERWRLQFVSSQGSMGYHLGAFVLHDQNGGYGKW